jgi:phage-related minor tail protein
MADNQINVSVIVDPSQAQTGSADVVKAINDASASINDSLKNITSASTSTANAVRTGLNGVQSSILGMQSQFTALGAAVSAASQQMTAALNTVPNAANGASSAVGRLGRSATGVRREFIVLAHELATGNWTRLGGSVLVLGERLDILSKLTSVAGLSLGFIAAGIAAVAFAAIEGSRQLTKLDDDLALTGNRAGLTADSYYQMAQTIADANGKLTVGAARGAVGATAGTGAFGPDAVQAVSAAVAEISRLSGQSAEKVAADFAKMSEGVYKFANDNAVAKNALTAADAEYVRTLEIQGRREEAEIYTAERISASLKKTEDDLGELPGFWDDVGKAASAAWAAMENIGKPDTPGQKLEALKAQLAEAKDALASGLDASAGGVGSGASIAGLQAQVDAQQKLVDARAAAAKLDADNAAKESDKKEALVRLHSETEELRAQESLQEKIARYQADIKLTKGIYTPSAVEQAEQIAKWTKEAADAAKVGQPRPLTSSAADEVPKAQGEAELALLKDRLSFETGELEKSYKANEISLKEYYDQRASITRQGLNAEIAVATSNVGNAQSAAKFATTPADQQRAQAAIVESKGKLALLNQQLNEQETSITEQYQEQQKLLDNKLATIQVTANVSRGEAQIGQEQAAANLRVALGQETQAKLIQEELQFEDRRYQIALTGATQRAALEDQSPEKLAQLNAQLESLEEQHQARMTQLQNQQLEQQNQMTKQVTDDIKGDFESAFASILDHTKTAKQAFFDFLTDIVKQAAQITAKLAGNALFGSAGGTGGASGGSGSGLLGALFSGVFGGGGLLGGGGGSSQGSSSAGGLLGMFGSLFGGLFGGSSTAAATGEASSGLSGLDSLASIIPPYAKGTNYVPQTGLALLHKGEAVVPAAYNKGGGRSTTSNVIQNFTLAQSTDYRTQQQMSGAAASGLQRAMRRNQ